MYQSHEEQGSPEYYIGCRYYQKHLDSLYALAFHSSQIISHFTMFLQGTRSLKQIYPISDSKSSQFHGRAWPARCARGGDRKISIKNSFSSRRNVRSSNFCPNENETLRKKGGTRIYQARYFINFFTDHRSRTLRAKMLENNSSQKKKKSKTTGKDIQFWTFVGQYLQERENCVEPFKDSAKFVFMLDTSFMFYEWYIRTVISKSLIQNSRRKRKSPYNK